MGKAHEICTHAHGFPWALMSLVIGPHGNLWAMGAMVKDMGAHGQGHGYPREPIYIWEPMRACSSPWDLPTGKIVYVTAMQLISLEYDYCNICWHLVSP